MTTPIPMTEQIRVTKCVIALSRVAPILDNRQITVMEAVLRSLETLHREANVQDEETARTLMRECGDDRGVP